jgi:hypothetical protein
LGPGAPHYPDDENRAGEKRRIYITESDDMIHWPEPVLCLAPTYYEDNFDDSYYGMTRISIGGLWVGFLNVFHQVDNAIDVRLVHSRDHGRSWNQIPGNVNKPFLPRGPPGSWDQYMVNIPSQPIQVGDELWVYYGGAKIHHDFWSSLWLPGLDHPEAAEDMAKVAPWGLGFAKLRLDGFVSLDAGVREGILAAKPFFSDGKYLIVNAECESNGYIEAEICNAKTDDPWDGYAREDCDTFEGDSVNHTFSWKGRTVVNIILDWTRLRFYMKNAKIYSFRVADR